MTSDAMWLESLTEDERQRLDAELERLQERTRDRLKKLQRRALRIKPKQNLPATLKWLKAEGYPTKGRRGVLALAALAELTTVLKPWASDE